MMTTEISALKSFLKDEMKMLNVDMLCIVKDEHGQIQIHGGHMGETTIITDFEVEDE